MLALADALLRRRPGRGARTPVTAAVPATARAESSYDHPDDQRPDIPAPDVAADAIAESESTSPVDGDASCEGSVDADDADVCAPVACNLFPEGYFSGDLTGWSREDQIDTQIVDGRCGRKALRVYDAGDYGRIELTHDPFPLAAGANLRMRAWFKQGLTPGTTPKPVVFLRSYTSATTYDDYYVYGDRPADCLRPPHVSGPVRTGRLESEPEADPQCWGSLRS